MNILPFETAWSIIIAFVVFLIGFFISLRTSKPLNISTGKVILFYLWHSFFCITYMVYSLTYSSDSIGYYAWTLREDFSFKLGTQFIKFFSQVLVSSLGLSYLGLFLVFNIFGSIGLLLFYASIKQLIVSCSKNIRRLALCIALLPSISFWSSALGKDAISFLAVNLALWATLNLSSRKLLMSLAIGAMLLVRPHMAAIMLVALIFSLIIGSKQINLVKKTAILSIAFTISIVLLPFAADYSRVGDISNPSNIIQYIEKRQAYNMEGGGGIEISSMSLPMQIFTYLFRPLPHEANSITALFASLDNLVLLLLFLYAVRFIRKKPIIPVDHVFLWLYSLASLVLLAMTTANLGISVRQKWMFMSILIYLLFSGIAARQAQKRDKKLANKQLAYYNKA